MSVTQSARLKEIFPVMKQVRDQFAAMGCSEQYHDELEYLHIEHLRLYGMFRFLRSPLTKELKTMSDTVMQQFYPHWKKHPISGMERSVVFKNLRQSDAAAL